MDFVRDFSAGLSNLFGGRSGAYEEELMSACETALWALKQRVRERGANAVIGVDIHYIRNNYTADNMCYPPYV